MENLHDIAEKIFSLDIYSFRDAESEPGSAVQDIMDDLQTQNGCIDIIKFLLDYIENMEG